ncbi:MAG: MFS transporter [Promethearchaeota archaeon]|nr:MAG: MFS transporter [Candidatus Lokiarchaeota archaeon]
MNVEIDDTLGKPHSKLTMLCYGIGGGGGTLNQWVNASMGFFVLFFYEAVIGLDIILAALAFALYSIWNAVNDPLMGYLMEKISPPWERKKGLKRFPWLLIGIGPWLLSFLLIYSVPLEWDPQKNSAYNLPVFGWMLFSLCLYDTFISLYDVNVYSLYTDKFPGLDERRTVQGIGAMLGITGTVLASIITPMFITTGVAASYRFAAIIVVIVGAILFIISIPGLKEDKRTMAQYQKRREKLSQDKPESFIKAAKTVVPERTFMGRYLLTYGWQVAAVMLQFSAFYIVTYLLDAPAGAITLLLLPMIVGALISIPIWTVISNKTNDNKKICFIGGLVMVFSLILMAFNVDIIGWMITFLIFGTGLGSQWLLENPMMGDVIDDATVRTGKRQQGIYFGYQSFFVRVGHSTIVILIAIVHILTGFVEGAPNLSELKARSPTPELALIGIRIHAAIIPAIILFVMLMIFWKLYDLTPEKINANKEKLKELGL